MKVLWSFRGVHLPGFHFVDPQPCHTILLASLRTEFLPSRAFDETMRNLGVSNQTGLAPTTTTPYFPLKHSHLKLDKQRCLQPPDETWVCLESKTPQVAPVETCDLQKRGLFFQLLFRNPGREKPTVSLLRGVKVNRSNPLGR